MSASAPASRRARLNAALAGLGERMERRTGLLLLGLAALLWGFLALAGEVMEGDTAALDRALLLMLRAPGNPAEPLGPRWVQEMGRDVTALGGIAVLTLVTLAATAFLALRRLWSAAALLAFSVAGGMLVSTLLKEAYERPRPDLVPHAAYVMTSSFPSGHSMMSAVVYLTLGALLARVEPGLRVKAFLLGLATAVTVLVGISRVYLGVHWPTDVAAGWALGAAWAALCWLLARALQRRGQVGVDQGG